MSGPGPANASTAASVSQVCRAMTATQSSTVLAGES